MAKRSDDERTRSALQAKIRELDGQRLTQQQSRDLIWYDKRTREEIAEHTIANLPKGVYCKLAGRQHSVIDKMARHYRLESLLGETIDLYDAILELHDLIADNSRMIQPLRRGDPGEEDTANIGDQEESEEIYILQIKKLKETVAKLEIANDRARIGLKKDKGDAIDRIEVRRMLELLSERLKGFGQRLRRSKGGPDAQKSLNEFLDTLADEIREGEFKV